MFKRKRDLNKELVERLAAKERECEKWRDAYYDLLALFAREVKG